MNTIHALARAASAAETAHDVPITGPILLGLAVVLSLAGIAAVFVEALLPARGLRT